jgi:hypothetical protein
MIIVLGVVLFSGWATGNLTAAVPAALLIWCGWLYVNPFKVCGWCKGSGRHKLSSARTFGPCWNPRCRGGAVQRLGSKTVHRAVRALREYRHRNNGK